VAILSTVQYWHPAEHCPMSRAVWWWASCVCVCVRVCVRVCEWFVRHCGLVFVTMFVEYTHCFNSNCYPLAFGTPAVLMVFSLGLSFCWRTHIRSTWTHWMYTVIVAVTVLSGRQCITTHAQLNWYQNPQDRMLQHLEYFYKVPRPHRIF